MRSAHHGTCQRCGKQAYSTRKAARAAFRAALPGEEGLEAYRCLSGNGVWHYGHSRRRRPASWMRTVETVVAR